VTKATDTKSSTNARPAHGQQSQQPFFSKGEEHALSHEAAPEKETPAPFFVQRKLTIGKPDDHFEKEADSVADKVVQRMSEPAAEQTVQAKPLHSPTPQTITAIPTAPAKAAAPQESLQMKEETEGKEKDDEGVVQRKPIFDSMADPSEDRVQRKPIFDSMAAPQEDQIQRKENGTSPEPAGDGLQQRLQSSKGGGQPLPAETRSAMESSIGADFSGVRVHTGKEAASLSNELGAQAFTHGNDIYFNEGKYAPSDKSGQHLLAHELTHTVQQGASIQRKPDTSKAAPDTIQRSGPSAPGAAKGGPPAASGEVVNVASGNFLPSAKQKEKIKEAGDKGLEVNVSAGDVAGAGTMKVYEKDGSYFSKGTGYLPMKLSILQPANPMLAVQMKDGKVSGFGTVGRSANKNSIPQWLRNDGKALSWLNGIDVKNAPQPTNTFENGNFNFWLNGVKVKVSNFADATLNFGVTNMKPVANVSVDMDIKGMAKGNLNLTLKDNVMFGEGSFDVQFKNFKGSIAARFAEGMLDVKGTVGYDGDKLSGSLTLIMTDKATADSLARDTVKAAGGNVKEAAAPAAVPAAGQKAGPRALAGVGTLTFNMTEWFAGSVSVIVDGEGEITVVGKIAPPKEIILFEQKDYSKELFKLEARAAYGIPVVGNVFVFANMALIALAKVGPAKIYNIEVDGVYSTRSDIAKSISLSGSLNISAYAGLRLRAEGGVGLEILDHDIKVGVGVNADAGVKGYIDARPTIGYRDPGEFFFKGHMEIAAQPFLGLSGDLFAEVDSPWWSPLPDKKWTWPIGSLEYALPGEFGIGADMEYVLGSGKVPEIKFGEAQFDGQKFMTDLVDDHVPQKGGGGKGDKQGKFVDGGAAGAGPGAGGPGAAGKGGGKGPAAGGKGDAPKGAAPKPATGKGGGKGGDKKPKGDEKVEDMKNFAEAMKAVKSLEQRTKPMTRDEITSAVESIKKRFKVQTISVAPQGTEWWIITGSVKGKPNKQSAKVKASMKPGDEKDLKGKDKEKQQKLDKAISALKAKDKSVAGSDKDLKKEEADSVAGSIQSTYNDIFKSIKVIGVGDHWEYSYIQRSVDPPVPGSKVAAEVPQDLKEGTYVKSSSRIYKILSVNWQFVKWDDIHDSRSGLPIPTKEFIKKYQYTVLTPEEVAKVTLPPDLPLGSFIKFNSDIWKLESISPDRIVILNNNTSKTLNLVTNTFIPAYKANPGKYKLTQAELDEIAAEDPTWRSKMSGNAQKSKRETPGHEKTMYATAVKYAKKKTVKKVYLDTSYYLIFGLPKPAAPETPEGRQPDVFIEFTNGSFLAIEIRSDTDDPRFLRSRNEAFLNKLPPTTPGTAKVEKIPGHNYSKFKNIN